MINSDTENGNETHSAREDFMGVLHVTIECNKLQNDNEITVFG